MKQNLSINIYIYNHIYVYVYNAYHIMHMHINECLTLEQCPALSPAGVRGIPDRLPAFSFRKGWTVGPMLKCKVLRNRIGVVGCGLVKTR